tara:strand:- start:107 stop:1687 length:1581 start_codon:yes stop_codon:yes gene_type:complete
MRFLTAFACTAVLAVAQSPLTTTFANNNSGGVGGAIYFDLTDTLGGGLTITDLDLNLNSTSGSTGTIDVYQIFGGTFRGNESNMAAWSLLSSGPVTSSGAGQPSNVLLNPPIIIPPLGSSAIALVANGLAHAYTNGTGGAGSAQVFSTTELTLTAGTASNSPFATLLFDPRIPNINIHYSLGTSSSVATNTSLGQGCIREYTSFFENFAPGAFDLNNTAISLLSTGNNYLVTSGGTYNPVGSLGTPTTLTLPANGQVAAGTLGLQVGSNGWVALGSGNSTAATPSVATLLSNPATAFYCWKSLNPTATGSGPVQYEEDVATGRAQVTFDGVFDSGGTTTAAANFVQFQVDTATNNVVIAWQTMSPTGIGIVVGYSPGGASVDPGATDLSQVASGNTVILTGNNDITPLSLTATSRPVLGTSWNLEVQDIPASTVFGVNIFGASDPGILDLSFLGLPGCELRANVDFVGGPWMPTGTTFNYVFPMPAMPLSLVGFEVFTQAATFGVPPVNAFGAITSNGVKGIVGDI